MKRKPKRMNTSGLLLLFFLVILSSTHLYTQTIIDITVDRLYLHDGELLFINEGEVNTFECVIYPYQMRDYVFDLRLDCDKIKRLPSDTAQIHFSELLKFQNTDSLVGWLKQREFVATREIRNLRYKSVLQYFNEHAFAHLDYWNGDKHKSIREVDFYDYVFIRINQQHLLIALVDEDDAYLNGYIIPKKNGSIVTMRNMHHETDSHVDTIDLMKHFSPQSFFRVKTINGKKQLYDKLFGEQILDVEFKNLSVGTYILGETPDGITIYDRTAKEKIVTKIRTTASSAGSLQFIKGNKLFWLDSDGIMRDTFPKFTFGVCGNTTTCTRKILKQESQFIEIAKFQYFGDEANMDTTILITSNKVEHVLFLNNENHYRYAEYAGYSTNFSYPYSYLVYKTADKSILVDNTKNRHVGRLGYVKLDIVKELLRKRSDLDNKMATSIPEHEDVKILIEGALEFFGYHHPIRFKIGEHYGYFPQNTQANYQRLDMYISNYARFTDKHGRSGWLSIDGIEYFDL